MGFQNTTFATLTCVHLSMGSCLVPLFPAPAAKPPPVGAVPGSDSAKVVRLLFEADVCWNLGQRERAREIYRKADPSCICPPNLVSADMAARGGGERLYLEMEAARNGDMGTLRLALDRLYLGRIDPSGDPQFALELFAQARKANPKGTFEHEEAIAELLKRATAPGAFDIRAFLEMIDDMRLLSHARSGDPQSDDNQASSRAEVNRSMG